MNDGEWEFHELTSADALAVAVVAVGLGLLYVLGSGVIWVLTKKKTLPAPPATEPATTAES